MARESDSSGASGKNAGNTGPAGGPNRNKKVAPKKPAASSGAASGATPKKVEVKKVQPAKPVANTGAPKPPNKPAAKNPKASGGASNPAKAAPKNAGPKNPAPKKPGNGAVKKPQQNQVQPNKVQQSQGQQNKAPVNKDQTKKADPVPAAKQPAKQTATQAPKPAAQPSPKQAAKPAAKQSAGTAAKAAAATAGAKAAEKTTPAKAAGKPGAEKPTQNKAQEGTQEAQQKSDKQEGKGASTSEQAPQQGRRRQWLAALALTLALILAVPLTIFGVDYARADLPAPGDIKTAQISTIYASDEKTELARLVPPEGNREQITLDDVPKHVQDAVLAAEDRDFWKNSGFSFTGLGRAVVGQITGNETAGGGSTITQQYVKNTIVGNEHSLQRKYNELVYAIKMTNKWSKEEILTGYLNTIYFGRNAYGIQAAASAYFDKDVSELTVEEGALLAGLIQLPSQLDPANNRQEAEARWNYVLDGLVDMGDLDDNQRAGASFPETRDPDTYSAYTEATGPNGLIKDRVIDELKIVGISEADVTNRGLQITTTIDAATQQNILDSAESQLNQLQDDARAAVVAVEPSTGAVRGYYGGDDATGWDYANAGLQTGSTFKIFGLAAALQQGIPLSAMYDSSPITINGTTINNDSGSGGGMTTMADALKNSYNTSFIRIQSDLDNRGEDTAAMAYALGVARSFPGVDNPLYERDGNPPYDGIVLGQYQSRVVDMATGVATLIDRGVWHPTHFVQRVTTADGEVLYEFDPEYSERRVSTQVADNVVDAMQPIAGWSRAALAGGRPSAAKTGTVQLGDTGGTKDAWMVGGTPQLAVAVWVGTATGDNSSPLYSAYGGNMYGSMSPSAIWKQVLDRTLEGEEAAQFPGAQPINWGVNAYSGGSYPSPGASANRSQGQSQSQSQNQNRTQNQQPAQQSYNPAPAPEQAPAPAPEQVELPELPPASEVVGDLLDSVGGQ